MEMVKMVDCNGWPLCMYSGREGSPTSTLHSEWKSEVFQSGSLKSLLCYEAGAAVLMK